MHLTISQDQVEEAKKRVDAMIDAISPKEEEDFMKLKNCQVEKFTPKGPNKDGECITTITIKAVNMTNEEIGRLANFLDQEVDMTLGESPEDRNGQYKMNLGG